MGLCKSWFSDMGIYYLLQICSFSSMGIYWIFFCQTFESNYLFFFYILVGLDDLGLCNFLFSDMVFIIYCKFVHFLIWVLTGFFCKHLSVGIGKSTRRLTLGQLSIGVGRSWKAFYTSTALNPLWSIEILSVITFLLMATKGRWRLGIWALLQFSVNHTPRDVLVTWNCSIKFLKIS